MNLTVALLVFISPIFKVDSLQEISSKATDMTSLINSVVPLKMTLALITRSCAMTDELNSSFVLIMLSLPFNKI
ncbi:MAG: hypothetical protein SO324_15255 [Thomasclavelia ramosa]|nr:hypothetical protein [Thomasclavelia ramosa]